MQRNLQDDELFRSDEQLCVKSSSLVLNKTVLQLATSEEQVDYPVILTFEQLWSWSSLCLHLHPLFLDWEDSIQLQISGRLCARGRLVCQGSCESIAEGDQSFSQRGLLKM